MCKVWIYLVCTHLVLLTNIPQISTEPETTTTTEVTTLAASSEISEVNSTNLLPTAAKLISYPHSQPLTIIRHISRPIRLPRPRRRLKSPRPAYGPPKYVFGDPITFYRPKPPAYFESSKRPSSTTLYDFESFKQEFDTDLGIQKLPISAYDKEPIELDLYESGYKRKRPHGKGKIRTEYLYVDAMTEAPHVYRHPSPYETPQTSHYEPAGNQINSGYSYDPQKPQFDQPPQTHYEPRPPAGNQINSGYSYDPPEHSQPQFDHAPQTHYEPPPPTHNSYSEYAPTSDGNFDDHQAQQPPFETPPQHFAEPPTSIEVTYSPSYEISPMVPGTSYGYPVLSTYKPPDTPQRGSYAKQPSQSSNQHQSHGDNHYLSSQETHANLPLNENKAHGYDYPKSSYEVPLYEAVPFDSNANSYQDDFYPPVQHNSYNSHRQEQEPESKKPSNKIEVTLKRYHHSEKERQVRPTTPPNYPSKYPTSISTFHPSIPLLTRPTTSSTTTTTRAPFRTRKRARITPKPKKHNLDTEELRSSYDKRGGGHRKTQRPEPELIPYAASSMEEIVQPAGSQDSFENFDDGSWEPAKIKSNRFHRNAQNGAEIDRAESNRENVVVSIEKSISHSYYGGTVRPDVVRNQNDHTEASNGMHVLSAKLKVASRREGNETLRGQVFDDEELRQAATEWAEKNLPKNHKIF